LAKDDREVKNIEAYDQLIQSNKYPLIVESTISKISYIEGCRRLGKRAKSLKNWWLRPDLNRGPHHYEYDKARINVYVSITYWYARCANFTTMHNSE